MSPTDTTRILFDGMNIALTEWADRYGGASSVLYWVLRCKAAEVDPALDQNVRSKIPESLKERVDASLHLANGYFGNVRYSTLEPVTMLWGTIVNSLRVAAESDRAKEVQKRVFDYPPEDIVGFLHGARFRMEVADQLYHLFKAMPAPECQALAALLNVHVDAPLDAGTVRRLVRLLDHEGPMSAEETEDLNSISNTSLVDAAFAGLRRQV
ncbi:MAG: hypothetical protein KJO07_25335 [Deltaproteobacteria bacterium]|nr:hypothetical protein [Deltaproteobacteria bacterium]